MSNPSNLLPVILVGRPVNDPALDLTHGDASRLLTNYERSRSEEDLKALPLLPSKRPVTFILKPLSASGLRFVKESPSDETRAQRAVLVTCHSFTDENGIEVHADSKGKIIEGDRRFSVASDEWLEYLLETFGNAALMELAAVALQRAEAGPRAIAPFRLPRGSMLPV